MNDDNKPSGSTNFSKLLYDPTNIKEIFFFPLTKENMNKNDQELIDMSSNSNALNTNEVNPDAQQFIIIKISDDDSVSREIVDLSKTAPKLEIYALSHNIIRANDSIRLPNNENYINCIYCGTKNRVIRDYCYECTNFL